jgi:hypothetical protein
MIENLKLWLVKYKMTQFLTQIIDTKYVNNGRPQREILQRWFPRAVEG